MEIKIPGMGDVKIKYVVFDLNGTLSMSGEIDPVLPAKMKQLMERGLEVYILSSDTRGKLRKLATELGVMPKRVKSEDKGAEEKAEFIKKLGEDSVIAVGNGMNDYLMLKLARIGIVILGSEGAATKSIINGDICVKNPINAIDIILDPITLKSTLRS